MLLHLPQHSKKNLDYTRPGRRPTLRAYPGSLQLTCICMVLAWVGLDLSSCAPLRHVQFKIQYVSNSMGCDARQSEKNGGCRSQFLPNDISIVWSIVGIYDNNMPTADNV